MILHLDLDGVLFDLEKGYEQQFGYIPGPADGPPDAKFWPNIMRSKTFFRDLPLLEDADLLVAEAVVARSKGIVDEVCVLTSCSDTWYDSVRGQKLEAIAKHFGDTFDAVHTVRRGRDKARYARHHHDILVDDTHENIAAWRKAPGQGILYRAYHHATPDLRRALNASNRRSRT